MSEVPPNSYAVILAGGGGTRLWPKSRQKAPKHLLKLFGDKTMLQLTFERAAAIFPRERIFIITFKDHLEDLLSQLPEVVRENVIVEPQPKNTALAMGVAAAFVYHKDPEASIINFAADHIILDGETFKKDVCAALSAAKEYGWVTAIGIKPTFPHTGLGYIKKGGELKSADDNGGVALFNGGGFKEKPDLETAKSFLSSGDYLWNANIYSWSAKAILDELRKHAPEIAQKIDTILGSIGTPQEREVMEKMYEECPNQQIDTAVSEKVDHMVVIAGEFDWSDVGDWKVVFDMQEKDSEGNVVNDRNGNVIEVGNSDCLIESNGRLIAAVGLENVVIVDTEDAILIVNKDKTQDVKKVIEKLKEEKKEKYL